MSKETTIFRIRISIFVIILAAFFSILALHYARRWHPDEAFYMSIARNAAVKGDWMLVSEPLDKPPLTYYINALSLVFLAVDSDANGVLYLDVHKGEFAGRVPALLMSVVLVAVIVAIIRTTTDDWCVVCLAGLLAALSPLRIVFAPTAFTDMPMLLLATLSLWLAMRGKYGWAGFWFILAFATKPQCVFYLPLLIGVMVMNRRGIARYAPTNATSFMLPLLIGGLLLWAWDMARVNLGATSFWALGQSYYTPTTLTPLADYGSRIRELWSTVQYLFGHGIITALLLIGATVLTLWQRDRLTLLLLLWLIGFFILHVTFTLNLHDRNLLLILPVGCLLVGLALRSKNTPLHCNGEGTLSVAIQGWGHHILSLQNLCVLCVFAVLLFFAGISATGAYDIGGDDGRHEGIDGLADYLNSKPVATVIYDRWLDWELDYYMGEWTNKRRVYYPTPQQLAQGALQLKETGVRYFVVPVDENITDWLNGLADADFTITLDYESANFRVYALVPP